MSSTRVLVIGLDPVRIPGFDPAPIQRRLALGRARFAEYGLTADECLLAPDDRPEDEVVRALRAAEYGCVVIGGGIRGHEPLLELFERVVNLVRLHAPGAAIAFGTGPEDCADAALRWLPRP